MNLFRFSFIFFASVLVMPASLKAADVDNFSLSSIGRNAKLTFGRDLLVPANKSQVALRESGRGDGRVVSTCTVDMLETSLDARVLKSGAQITFTGEAEESESGEWKVHVLKVEQPQAIKSVTCYAMRMDMNYKWHPTLVIIWDLKAAFSGLAELVLPEPVEIPTP